MQVALGGVALGGVREEVFVSVAQSVSLFSLVGIDYAPLESRFLLALLEEKVFF